MYTHLQPVFRVRQNSLIVRKQLSVNCRAANHKMAHLDLDYLECRKHVFGDLQSTSEAEASPDSVNLVKVIMLGASGVGKTSIVQQFVWNSFSDDYTATDSKHTYYPSVIINDRLYELKILDLPVLPYFPVSSYYEWTDYRFCGLRNANAYILVFDLSNLETFHYIKAIREQIVESRDTRKVPLIVVGNKQDLLAMPGVCSTTGSGNSGRFGIVNMSSGERTRDIMVLVKKHWKCGYIECSARYNCKVVAVFKELMKSVDAIECSGPAEQGHRDVYNPMIENLNEAFDRHKCNLF